MNDISLTNAMNSRSLLLSSKLSRKSDDIGLAETVLKLWLHIAFPVNNRNVVFTNKSIPDPKKKKVKMSRVKQKA